MDSIVIRAIEGAIDHGLKCAEISLEHAPLSAEEQRRLQVLVWTLEQAIVVLEGNSDDVERIASLVGRLESEEE